MALTNILTTVKEDDYVEFFIFPPVKDYDEETEKLYLNNYVLQIYILIEKYSKNYLWHKDSFNVIARSSSSKLLNCEEIESSENLPPHIYGILYYGDNIEDEWFTVYLLHQLTKEMNDIIVRVTDNDGEFLLIEAANFLPKWASPEYCENRTYLYQGKIHFIPIHEMPPVEISVPDALKMIRSNSALTEASTNIQNAILARIKDYPDKIKSLMHRTKAYLPVGIAVILEHKPGLIAAAINAFRNRDLKDMNACRAMKYFPPENRVYTSVLFTKILYSSLINEQFNPDQKIGWNLPRGNSPEYKYHMLGVKIACGFEILVAQFKNNSGDNDKGWKTYLKNLQEKSYFRDNLEGSEEYNKLLEKAKEFYKEQRKFFPTWKDIGEEIFSLNTNLDYNLDDFKNKEANLPEDDSDSWLNITQEELEKMLCERYGQENMTKFNRDSDASKLTNTLSEFLDTISSVDGAEFPSNESSPVRPQRGIKKKDKKTPTKNENTDFDTKGGFDPDKFSCAVQNMLDFAIPDDCWDLESESEMSEYDDESESKLSNKMKEYMDEMDRQLAHTTMGESFEKKPTDDNFDDIESFQPVDIDMNALKSILEGYQGELGSGPATNLLGPMGIHMERSQDDKPSK